MVERAAMWHRKVMAHAHGTEGIKRAIAAGVASIDHGSFIDNEGIRMLKERRRGEGAPVEGAAQWGAQAPRKR